MLHLHAGAHFKNIMFPAKMVMDVVAGAFGGDSDTSATQSDTSRGRTMSQKNNQKPASSRPALPAWFPRKPGRRYNVISSEASLGTLRRAVKEWGN